MSSLWETPVAWCGCCTLLGCYVALHALSSPRLMAALRRVSPRGREEGAPVENGEPGAAAGTGAAATVAAGVETSTAEFKATQLAFSYKAVVLRGQFYRVLTSCVTHLSLGHLLLNLLSWYSAAAFVERRAATTKDAGEFDPAVAAGGQGSWFLLRYSLLLVVASKAISALLSWMASEMLHSRLPLASASIGASGLVFAWQAFTASRLGLFANNADGVEILGGLMALPPALVPLASVIMTQFVVPRASLVGHVGGLLAGYLLGMGILQVLSPVWTIVFFFIVSVLCIYSLHMVGFIQVEFIKPMARPSDANNTAGEGTHDLLRSDDVDDDARHDIEAGGGPEHKREEDSALPRERRERPLASSIRVSFTPGLPMTSRPLGEQVRSFSSWFGVTLLSAEERRAQMLREQQLQLQQQQQEQFRHAGDFAPAHLAATAADGTARLDDNNYAGGAGGINMFARRAMRGVRGVGGGTGLGLRGIGALARLGGLGGLGRLGRLGSLFGGGAQSPPQQQQHQQQQQQPPNSSPRDSGGSNPHGGEDLA